MTHQRWTPKRKLTHEEIYNNYGLSPDELDEWVRKYS